MNCVWGGQDWTLNADKIIISIREQKEKSHNITCLKEETTQPTTRRTSVAGQPSLVAAKKHLHCSRNCQNDCVFPFCSAESQTLESRENCKWTSNRLYNVLWLTAQWVQVQAGKNEQQRKRNSTSPAHPHCMWQRPDGSVFVSSGHKPFLQKAFGLFIVSSC